MAWRTRRERPKPPGSPFKEVSKALSTLVRLLLLLESRQGVSKWVEGTRGRAYQKPRGTMCWQTASCHLFSCPVLPGGHAFLVYTVCTLSGRELFLEFSQNSGQNSLREGRGLCPKDWWHAFRSVWSLTCHWSL